MTVVRVPEPSLVVLIGAAGAGKSTLAARAFAPDEVLSSDAFRGVVSGDEGNQAATRPAYAFLHRALDRRLALGRTTVIDATNVERHARRALLRRAERHRVPTIAIVLDLPPDLVRRRNLARARVVDPDVVERHLAQVRLLVDHWRLADEGFTTVVLLPDPDDLDRLVIERGSAPTPSSA
ncbi:MAG: AAA family ATPase [Chloroflexota bacterium]